jgi:two-component system, cell cycle response regulator DivK
MGKDYGPTVMVVEDYDDTRVMLKSILERKGFRVVEAVNGREAVERAASECPDLILMDLDLPILDGIEATNRIRQMGALCAVPIVAITAYPMSFTRVKAFAQGCDEYIPKPIELARLEEVLRRHLPTG